MATLVKQVRIEEHFMEPSADYPDGSYMRKIGGVVDIATGHYAVKHPDKPSLDWHGKPPHCFLGWDTAARTPEKESEKEKLSTELGPTYQQLRRWFHGLVLSASNDYHAAFVVAGHIHTPEVRAKQDKWYALNRIWVETCPPPEKGTQKGHTLTSSLRIIEV